MAPISLPFIKSIAHALTLGLLAASSANAADATVGELSGSRPNIVLVITDDNSFDTIGRYSGGVASPHLDQLYDQSIRLSRFHVSPTCAPSRASLMTGRHEFYAGVTHTIFGRDRMNLEQLILPEMLRKVGYTTGMFGKWHLGDAKHYRPYQRGFDEVWQHGAGGIGQFYPNSADFPANTYHDPVLLHNETPVQTEGYCTDVFFDKAIHWMKKCQRSDQPFFAYITTNAPHGPHIPPYGYDKRMPDATNYQKMQVNIDDNIGKLMAFLKDSGLSKDTLFIFHTDNGRGGQTVHGTKLKGGKGTAREGGLWVPCLISWPGKLPKNIDRTELTAHIDWFMTFAALAGSDVARRGTEPWDGRNLLPVLTGTADKGWDNRLFVGHKARWKNGTRDAFKYNEISIQNGRFKLYNHLELYDMRTDRGESKNIADQYPEVVATLQHAYDSFWRDAQPHMINDSNPLAAKDIEHEPFHQLYRAQFGAEDYQKRMARLAHWKSISKKKGGQPVEDFERHLQQH